MKIMYHHVILASLACSALLTPIIRLLAIRFRIMDRPVTDIKNHKEAVPYLGGAAIFMGLLLGLVVMGAVWKIQDCPFLSAVLVFSSLFLLGTMDDVFSFSARKRFLFQFLIFGAFLFHSGYLIRLTGVPALDIVITLFWLVGLTNAFNIIDIMDGLSSGVAIISAAFMAFVGYVSQNHAVTILGLSVAGSGLGFIGYNFSKKYKIFMGDGGSTLLGGVLATSSLIFCHQFADPTKGRIAFATMVLLFGIPIYDTILVMILRIRKGISPFKGSRDHFALRMVYHGFSRIQTVMSVYVVTFSLGLFGLIMNQLTYDLALMLMFAVIFLALMWGQMLSIIDISTNEEKSNG